MVLLVAVVAAAEKARAQVNIEPIRESVDASGFGARLDGSLTTYAGNTEGLVAGANVLAGASGGSHLAFLNASGDYTRLGEETQVQKSFVHLRYNYEAELWAWWEVFAQLETDRFRRIEVRALAGTGPRFQLLATDTFELYWGSAYMLEHTELNDEAGAAASPALAHRWSNYFTAEYQLHERIEASNVTYFQPRWDDFGDYRWFNVLGLGFTITDLIQTRVDGTVRYESRHPSGIGPVDVQIKNSISITL